MPFLRWSTNTMDSPITDFSVATLRYYYVVDSSVCLYS
uniref:Uncharacterized protein n=1 Tax=Anguilla anguilla TaxID=7936 RepID=A0A0E9SH04_ANGAN